MRRFLPWLLVCVLPLPMLAGASGLDGDWVVDLSTAPGQVYTQPMVLRLVADGTVTGSFYGSAIKAGRWRQDRGRLCASFRTTDGVGPYHTAVCLDGETASGQTWAEHRAFLFNWNATRPTP
ncbi:conserved exported hypothetical protein [Luteimonas sp. 9C]|uniref:hypothetical protein n=1 Tax=Luteimonas sp. 9C TaxID=2653148 RepID=UPI0012EFAAF7|nr:hypothetical protein [Luteimonas sp. 9C]VXC03264.1 conserved exported hypothetical protein [Luteimonas sp. 9C]